RLWIKLGVLNPKKFSIAIEDLGDRLGRLFNVYPALGGRLDDLVVDIGEVHHLINLPAAQSDDAPQQIAKKECAEVTEVRRPINRRAAGIKANGFAIGGSEWFDFAGKGVVEAKFGLRHFGQSLSREGVTKMY